MKKLIEAFEKSIERLREQQEQYLEDYKKYADGEDYRISLIYERAIKIVNQVEAEYAPDINVGNNDGWIPCSERLPDRYCHCLVTRRNDYEDGGFDSDVREDVYIELEGVWDWQSKFEGLIDNIIAWQPLPAPYQPKGD